MTVNAGTGPPSPCGKPLVRVGHGVYALRESEVVVARPAAEAEPIARRPRPTHDEGRPGEVQRRVAELIAGFGPYVEIFDRSVPFTRENQFEYHRLAIDRRRTVGGVVSAVNDDYFMKTLYNTLRVWGIGRRASRLVPFNRFQEILAAHTTQLSALKEYHIEDPDLDVATVSSEVWSLIESLDIVDNISRIVPGTKTLLHLLPDLVPPMDRAWTGAFFLWSVAAPQSGQRNTFIRAFTAFAKIAATVTPSRYVGDGWRTCPAKILDNAMIGYCKANDIAPNTTN